MTSPQHAHSEFCDAVCAFLGRALSTTPVRGGAAWRVRSLESTLGAIDYIVAPDIAIEQGEAVRATISCKRIIAEADAATGSELVDLAPNLSVDTRACVVTAECDPVRLAVLVYGSVGAVATYHWHWDRLMRESQSGARELIVELIASNRLRDIRQLPTDLAA